MSSAVWECPTCGGQIVGIEYRGVYDGVAEWGCAACDWREPRFGPDHYVTRRLNKQTPSTAPSID